MRNRLGLMNPIKFTCCASAITPGTDAVVRAFTGDHLGLLNGSMSLPQTSAAFLLDAPMTSRSAHGPRTTPSSRAKTDLPLRADL